MFLFRPMIMGFFLITFTTAKQNVEGLEKAYIIRLSSDTSVSEIFSRQAENHIDIFHERAAALDYEVRYEFKNRDVFLGLSIQVASDEPEDELFLRIQAITGVESVSRIINVGIPVLPNTTAPADPFLSYANPPPLPFCHGEKLDSTLQMGGVDKLHDLGIKGKGIKIGFVDTGVDYRHQALGGGFGPGYKIAGGYSFVSDNGTISNSSDPLTTCFGGGHGTHVSGIVGMESNEGGFNITGVAPEASLYMYKALSCDGTSAGDSIMAAMMKALEDEVDILSMSIASGPQSFSGEMDPLALTVKKLTDGGIAVIVANANDASGSPTSNNLYSEEWPSTEPTAIGVGAISNAKFPLIYSAIDSMGVSIEYASVWPVNLTEGADIYLMNDGCDSEEWNTVLSAINNVNNTIIAFEVNEDDQGCTIDGLGIPWDNSARNPVFIMALNAHTTNAIDPSQEDPYRSSYNTPSQGFFGTVQFLNMNAQDADVLSSNYNTSGGYLNYTLSFKYTNFTSIPQLSGGYMDYYSSFGPTWHDYLLKPQISAPGGNILSTWPLGPLGGYAIISGTSMATPYIAGCFALIKSQFPHATNQEILARLQTTATPIPWIYNTSMLASTAQQGAGLVNAYEAVFSWTEISPSQLTISDVSHTEYGIANLTISNKAPFAQWYIFEHHGAAYMDYTLLWSELDQRPVYGDAKFAPQILTLRGGESATVKIAVIPPPNIDPSLLPVFSGFIVIKSSSGSTQQIPYLGPPYSLYNTPYLVYSPVNSSYPNPQIWSYDSNGISTPDTGLLEFNSANGFGSLVETLQWTTAFRIDLLPANTTISSITTLLGYDPKITYSYIPSQYSPNSTVWNYKSFGTLANNTGYIWPGGMGVFRSDTSVTGDDGVAWSVGVGDYRWFVQVLRWGGSEDVWEDWETWLGPVVRFV